MGELLRTEALTKSQSSSARHERSTVRPLPTRSLGPTKQFTLQCCLCLCFPSMVAATRQFSLQLRRKFAKLCCCEFARSGQPISRHFVLTRRLAYFDLFCSACSWPSAVHAANIRFEPCASVLYVAASCLAGG